jgi:hypothetical protein
MQAMIERQAELDRKIVEELIAQTPETWRSAKLIAHRSGSEREPTFSAVVVGPEGTREVVGPTGTMFELLSAQYGMVLASTGIPWVTATYQVGQDDSGDWDYNIDFSYS